MSGIVIYAIGIYVVTVLISFLFNHFVNEKDHDGTLATAGLSFLIYAVLGGIVDFWGSDSFSDKHKTYEYRPLYLESLFTDKDTSISGAFILGTGGMSGGSYTHYVAYGKFNKGLKRIKIDAYDTYVLERDDLRPQIKNYYKLEVQNPCESWFWSWERKERRVYREDRHWEDYTLIVPSNTIYKRFEIND